MVNNNHFDREYLPYIKLWSDEWLSSSIHYNNSLEEQGYFIGLLTLAGKNRKERGAFSLEKGQPMPMNVIANALYIDVETCQRLWDRMILQERVSQRPDGVYCITNFEYYQKIYRRSRLSKDMAKQTAIEISEDERLRKKVRHNPDAARDELIKLNQKQQAVKDTNDAIDKIRDRADIKDSKGGK